MIIREMKDGDLNFILSTWLRSYYDSLTYFSKRAQTKIAPGNEVFFKYHQEKIKKVLPESSTFILTTEEDTNQIIGYITFQGDTLHFCYVKAPFRKMGIAKKLKEKAIGLTQYSHHTTYSKHIAKDLTFNPYRF